MECQTIDDVFSCLETGLALRHTGPVLNQLSSRSHGIFTLYLQQAWTQGIDEFLHVSFNVFSKMIMYNLQYFKMGACMKYALNSILLTWLDQRD